MFFRLLFACLLAGVTASAAAGPVAAQDSAAPADPASAEAPAAPEAPETPAAPEESTWVDRIELHGFGGWAYGRTDTANHYLNGAEDGDYEHAQLALNISAQPTERVQIFAQLEWHSSEEEVENEVDFAFAEISTAGTLRWRLGQVKQPFGIYNEILDVGVLRPFLDLPQAVYGATGFAAENYRGVGISGSGGRLEYDLYGGGLRTELDLPFDEAVTGVEEEEDEVLRDVIGGRLVLNVPGDLLRLGLSGYTGQTEDGDSYTAALAHAELLVSKLTVRVEGGRQEVEEESIDAYYVEASWRFNPRWQIAARHDDLSSEVLSPGADSLKDHRDTALGVSWWIGQNLAIKGEIHDVRGNRFAHPEEAEDLRDQVELGALEPDTQLFQLGVQFSF
jgi:hypothetical protein